MKKIFLLLASVFFSTMMFAQVLLWKDGEVIYSKNIDEVDKISFYEVEGFELVNDKIEMEYYGGWNERYKWIYVEFSPKKSYGVLEYKSSDEDIVTVSYDGRLAARGIGEATITVKLIGTELEQKCKVVVKGYEGSLQFNNDYVYLLPGQVYDELRGYISFEPYCWECREDLEWTSSNEKVVTVDEEGKITAVAVGQSIITAKLKNSEVSASTIVKVEDVEMGILIYDSYSGDTQDVEVLSLGVGGFKDVFVYFKNNYYPNDFKYEWISMDKNVVLFTNAHSSTYYGQELMGVAVGEADVIVKIVGTEIEDTIKVVVKPTDPMSVQFYDVLWRDNMREYPLDYDVNGDGYNDVVREIDLWLLGGNLDWVEENGETVGEDYFIYVPTACIFDGTYYYPFENYSFMDSYWEDDYLIEYNGEKYFKPFVASTSYFDSYSYCKYYEQLHALGDAFDSEDFKANYGWPIKNESSYIYYWNTETNSYITGLVRHGNFVLALDESDRGTTDICVSYMSMGLEFFAETPLGLKTKMVKDEETGEMVETFVTPYEMAPMIYRDIYFSNGYYAPQQKASMKMQGISEKALKANQLLNIPLQMKLQDIRF